jgi:replicative DNA helicase
MAQVYLTLARAAKITGVPFILLSQLSRSYTGGMPEITHLRYTGMAEALSALILLLYNPSAIFVSQSSGGALPRQAGKGYIIVGKSRYGHKYPGHGRFAIQCDWDGAAGWGDDKGIMKPL